MEINILNFIFFLIGVFEIVSNLNYLIKKNGISSARKQHKEIPPDVSDRQMRIKVICMLGTGVLAFIIALNKIVFTLPNFISIIILIVVAIYGWVEAFYYRYSQTYVFATFTTILFLIYLLF